MPDVRLSTPDPAATFNGDIFFLVWRGHTIHENDLYQVKAHVQRLVRESRLTHSRDDFPGVKRQHLISLHVYKFANSPHGQCISFYTL